MRAADTNVLVRILTRDDPAQAAAADAFAAAGMWVSTLVLAETAWVLAFTYRRAPDAVATAVDYLLQHGSIELQEPELVAAALTLYRTVPRVGFSDCLIFETTRRAGHLPLGTFDRALGRLPGAQQLRTPTGPG